MFFQRSLFKIRECTIVFQDRGAKLMNLHRCFHCLREVAGITDLQRPSCWSEKWTLCKRVGFSSKNLPWEVMFIKNLQLDIMFILATCLSGMSMHFWIFERRSRIANYFHVFCLILKESGQVSLGEHGSSKSKNFHYKNEHDVQG